MFVIDFTQNSNWITFTLSSMWLRILLVVFLGALLTFILTLKFPKKYIKNKFMVKTMIFIIAVVALGLFVIPKGIWKSRIDLSPPQTITKTQSFSNGSITEPSKVTLVFSSSSSYEDLIAF